MIEAKKQLLREIGKNPMGRVLVEYLEEEASNLKDVTKAKSWDDALGRGHAVKVIEGLIALLSDNKSNSGGKSNNQYT